MRTREQRALRRRMRRFSAVHETNPDECAFCFMSNMLLLFEMSKRVEQLRRREQRGGV